MSRTTNAGKFTIDLSPPYPVWCAIKYGGETIARIHHNELSDLEYVVVKAKQWARTILPISDKDEV